MNLLSQYIVAQAAQQSLQASVYMVWQTRQDGEGEHEFIFGRPSGSRFTVYRKPPDLHEKLDEQQAPLGEDSRSIVLVALFWIPHGCGAHLISAEAALAKVF